METTSSSLTLKMLSTMSLVLFYLCHFEFLNFKFILSLQNTFKDVPTTILNISLLYMLGVVLFLLVSLQKMYKT